MIVYNRNINNINLQNTKRASAFIDMTENNRYKTIIVILFSTDFMIARLDQEASSLLRNFRDDQATRKMKKAGACIKYGLFYLHG